MTVGVALPLPLDQLYFYTVPADLEDEVTVGCRVIVPFRRRKLTGVIVQQGDRSDFPYKLRPIARILDRVPASDSSMLELTRWIATYYVCSWGEALRAALPSDQPQHQNIRMTRYLRPSSAFSDASALRDVLEQLPGPKQKALIQACLHYIRQKLPLPPKPQLLAEAEASTGTAKRLTEMGILKETKEESFRRPHYGGTNTTPSKPPTLNAAQVKACESINAALERNSYATLLLHGVTGSGKTEVYLAALQTTLAQGRTAIVLVPEIALTPQTVQRFQARFGNKIAVLHSRISHGERYDAWRLLRSGQCSVVIGPRSAILAPLSNVGLIVVDEEHESSYKQHDPAPRYHARDVAVVRAQKAGAVCILGSATPSLESLHNAKIGKYQRLVMKERVPVPGLPAATLPEIEIVDLRSERPRGALSTTMQDAIVACKKRKQQVILLQNRRGYSPIWECLSCGWLPRCHDCSVTLTYHKARRSLRCHYCGYSEPLPKSCPRCGTNDFAQLGIGTQRVEEEIADFLPEAKVLRMDQDTTYRKNAHFAILDQFERGEADILVGTQMVAKGLDFSRVTLVGVISADVGMGLPDFRSEERTAQLMMQVSGRAGRHALPGRVIIQTRRTEHPIFEFLKKHDYEGFAHSVLEGREPLGYPPFGRITNVEFRGPEEDATGELAHQWTATARKTLPDRLQLLGPEPAYIARVKTKWRFHLMIKGPRYYRGLQRWLRHTSKAFGTPPQGYRVVISVDAVGLF